VRPRVARARVEVDEHVVGALDVVHAAVPGVQVDATEVDDPREASRLGHHGEVGRAPAAGKDDVNGFEPVGMRGGNTLLVEEEPVHAVRIAQHLHGAVADMREDDVRDVDVVADEVALGQPALREEDLVEVRDRDVAPADPHRCEAKQITLAGEARSGPATQNGGAGSPHTPGVWRMPVSA
jgi:hypothetical protein